MEYLLLIIIALCFILVSIGIVLVLILSLNSTEDDSSFIPHRHWQLDMINTEDGQKYSKQFNGHLMMGRDTAAPETENFLPLGEKQTISRRQCEIAETPNGMMIQNLSQVNMTMHNGEPLQIPHNFGSGDYLDIGGIRYYVMGLQYGA